MASRSRRRGANGIALLALSAFLLVFGGYVIWHTTVGLPRIYQRLQAGGVAAEATLVKCGRGVGDGRGVGCELAMTFDGVRRVWAYPENVPQFERLASGTTIHMLVDPSEPDVAYTVADVRARTNAGWGPVAFLGCFFVLFGAFMGAAGVRLQRRARRLPDW